jgi:hypothetical protein
MIYVTNIATLLSGFGLCALFNALCFSLRGS